MNKKNQQKNSTPPRTDAKAFKAVIAAIEECRAKPPYDYQRIILCQTNRRGLGSMLARYAGAALAEPADLPDFARAPAVIVVDKAGDCGEEALESVVFIINRTRGVVVLLAGARSMDKWRDQWEETWAKIRRRTHLTIEFTR